MELRNLTRLGVAFGLLMAVTTQVHAESVTLTCNNVTPGLTSGLVLNFTGADNVTKTYGSGAAYVGLINWTVASPTGSTFANGQTVSTYCIQGLQDVNLGSSYTYDITALPAVTPVGGQDTGFFSATEASEIQGMVNYIGGFNPGSGYGYSANSIDAAIQLAIWQVEYGTNFSVTSTVGTGEAADAVYLANLAYTYKGLFDGTPITSLTALTNGTDQDQIFIAPGGGTPPPAVPLPAALPAGLALMGGMAGVRKLRRKLA